MAKGPRFTRISPQQALLWFRNEVQRLSGVFLPKEIAENQTKTQEEYIAAAVKSGLFKREDQLNIGQMILFKYDPKYKKRLPYWDEYPLVFPTDYFAGGFLGINLHYLPSGYRAPILNQLGEMLHDSDKYDDEGRLNISYEILKENTILFSRFYKDCIRKYLYSNVRSSFHYVNPKNWNNVAALPFERWTYKK